MPIKMLFEEQEELISFIQEQKIKLFMAFMKSFLG